MEKSAKPEKRVTVVLSEQQIDALKKALRYQSYQEGRTITISEGIRRAVEVCYPQSKQMELF